jgi:hypothetical protein
MSAHLSSVDARGGRRHSRAKRRLLRFQSVPRKREAFECTAALYERKPKCATSFAREVTRRDSEQTVMKFVARDAAAPLVQAEPTHHFVRCDGARDVGVRVMSQSNLLHIATLFVVSVEIAATAAVAQPGRVDGSLRMRRCGTLAFSGFALRHVQISHLPRGVERILPSEFTQSFQSDLAL